MTQAPEQDPTRHWDGTRWLKWDGTSWQPEPAEDLTPVLPAAAVPAVRRKGRGTPWVIAACMAALFVGGILIGHGAAPTTTAVALTGAQPTATVTETATTTVTVTAAPSSAATATAPAASGGLADQGWTVISVSVKDDGIGGFGGSMRVRNDTGSAADSAVFTLTILKGGQPVGTAQGIDAAAIAPGKVISVDLISTDHFVKGPYTYEFQLSL